MEKPTVERFRELLPLICDEKTSSDPDGWTPENPLWGQCAVVSLAVQALFGGTLRRGSLDGTPFEKMKSHYWNNLDSGEVDHTATQFQKYMSWTVGEVIEFIRPVMDSSEERTREYLLSNTDTKKRYQLLMWRLGIELSGRNKIFFDQIYKSCFDATMESGCQKMKFGCAIVDDANGKVFCVTTNKPTDLTQHVCQPECVRNKIQSRTDQMLGACDHAEEWAIREIFRLGHDPKQCTLYIAGFKNDCLPYLKQVAEHTCLRCSSQIYRYGIGRVAVPVVDDREFLTGEQCVKTALPYSIGEKKA